MNSYLLILHEIPDESEAKLASLVDVIHGLGGGDRTELNELVHSLPAILCEDLTKDEADRWEVALEAAGASVEVIQSEASEAHAEPPPSPFTPTVDVNDLESALDDLISGGYPAVTPAMMEAVPPPPPPKASPPTPPPVKRDVAPPPPPPPPQAAKVSPPPPPPKPSTPLPNLVDLESALDNLLDSPKLPEASRPSQRKATVAYDSEELARRLAELDEEEESEKEADTAKIALGSVSSAPSQPAKPAPEKPSLSPLELHLDLSDLPEPEEPPLPEFTPRKPAPSAPRPAAPKQSASPAAAAPKPSSKQPPPKNVVEDEDDEEPIVPPTKPKAPKVRESTSSAPVLKSPGQAKRPGTNAGVTASKPNNPVIRPSASQGQQIPPLSAMEIEVDGDENPMPPAYASQTNRVTPVSNEVPQVAVTRQGMSSINPTVSGPPKKGSSGMLLALVAIFVICPIAFLLMPDRGPSTAVDPQAIERLLEQQQQMLDDIKATPAPTSGLTTNPNDTRTWVLKEATDKEESDISMTTNLANLQAGSFELRGRKFGALMQYDPKVPDQPIIFVREIVSKDLVPQENGGSLHGDGEALITSGTVSYRVGLDIAVSAEITRDTCTITIDIKGRKNGGMPNGAPGIEQIGPGEFRMYFKRTAVLKPKTGASASASDKTDKPDGKPGDPKAAGNANAKGSYQRIPMEFPAATAPTTSNRR